MDINLIMPLALLSLGGITGGCLINSFLLEFRAVYVLPPSFKIIIGGLI